MEISPRAKAMGMPMASSMSRLPVMVKRKNLNGGLYEVISGNGSMTVSFNA